MRRTRTTKNAPVPFFGAHLSIAGGLHRAIEAAQKLGCNSLQIFVKNQRQWSARPLGPVEIERWEHSRRRADVWPVFAHATYLINLASPEETIWRQSVDACVEELRRCGLLGIRGLIVHPGSHRGAGLDVGLSRIAHAIDSVCERLPGNPSRIVLETTAGQGNSVGGRFEHLAGIIARTREPQRIGICLDTCHVFAAGYELRTREGYQETMAELNRSVGLQRVCCVHVNDSKGARGSRLDRHEHIGRGRLGLRAFRLLVNDPRLAAVPKILETPKGLDDRGRDLDRLNLARLRRLVGGQGRNRGTSEDPPCL
jgi:deoxyribonuclease-4